MLAACIILAIVVIVYGVKVRNLNAQAADTQNQLAQSKSEAAQVQAELDKATAASTQLKAQLDEANGQQADLKNQLEQARSRPAELPGLQPQLDKAKTQSADLQSQLDRANAQSADLQAQLKQANGGSAQLLAQLDQAKGQVLELQARLNRAESDIATLKPLVLKARHMPIVTSFERKLWGYNFTLKRSYALHVSSLCPGTLSLFITITHEQRLRSQSSEVESGATTVVDDLAPGDKVSIDSEGYDPVNLTVQ